MGTKERIAISEATEKLDALIGAGDPEAMHTEADKIVCSLLRSLGAGIAADAFDNAVERCGFWYA